MSKLPLPPHSLRRGGTAEQNDETYLRTAHLMARPFMDECSVTTDSRVLDFGCGSGRLLHGLMTLLGSLRQYVGIDVHEPSIRWLTENIKPLVPSVHFIHSTYANDRYNPAGSRSLKIEMPDRFDAIALYSVFTHMHLEDISIHLAFLRRVLETSGRVYLTVFVEDDVPTETENPDNYFGGWSGPLHCVLFNRTVFEQTVTDTGFRIADYQYRKLGRQTCYRLQHA